MDDAFKVLWVDRNIHSPFATGGGFAELSPLKLKHETL